MTTISLKNIIGGVATFNADPYRVEDLEMAEEIMAEVENHGATVVEGDDRADALAKLDLPEDSDRVVYRAGGCLFCLDEETEEETGSDYDKKVTDLQNEFFAAWLNAQADKENVRIIIETDKVETGTTSGGETYSDSVYYMVDGADGFSTINGWSFTISTGDGFNCEAHEVAAYALKLIEEEYEHITDIYNENY